MSVRVRFAPSPTGYLHIGGARTALYSYLYARAKGGEFILRIEDTDLERSERRFEEAQIEDLKWVGLHYHEGPDIGGAYGPYRQSERLDIYKKHAWELIEKGHAYPCFLTQEELEKLTAKAEAENISPHAYHGLYRDLPLEEAKQRIDSGEEYVIRFRNPKKAYSFKDLVRGEVHFQEDMVGDFVIIRANGLPVYNYCCVVDDWLMKITHVIRAEEHLNNTVRQLMIYEALGVTELPEFAHVSLLVGEDRQKLSKRHGATSVTQYKEEHYIPEALINYLCLLGWSHPEEKDIFKIDDLGALFTLDRFNKAPALYDPIKLKYFNGEHLRMLPLSKLIEGINAVSEEGHVWHKQTESWQTKAAEFYKEKIQLFSDIKPMVEALFSSNINLTDELKEILSWETTPKIREFLKNELAAVTDEFLAPEVFDSWLEKLKKDLGIKGKPLFMGTRGCLTGEGHGPDLKVIVSLTPTAVLRKRLEELSKV